MATTNSNDRSLLCAVSRRGAGSPLYIVPSAGTTPLSLINLARSIDPPRPVYSFEFAGMEDESQPQDRIEDMAKDYVDEIRRHQPTGPYYIGGHCFGGSVAHDMVTKLEAMDERVVVLVVFDSICAPFADDGERTNVGPDQVPFDLADLVEHVENLIDLVGRHAKDQHAILPPAVAKRFEHIMRTHIDAAIRYRGGPTKAPISVVRSRTHDDWVFEGWRSIGGGGYSVVEVPGDTFSMLKPPHVDEVGQRLSEILNALQ